MGVYIACSREGGGYRGHSPIAKHTPMLGRIGSYFGNFNAFGRVSCTQNKNKDEHDVTDTLSFWSTPRPPVLTCTHDHFNLQLRPRRTNRTPFGRTVRLGPMGVRWRGVLLYDRLLKYLGIDLLEILTMYPNVILPIIMGKNRFMAISKVKAPDFNVPVSWPSNKECGIWGDVHTQHWKLVTVQGEEKLKYTRNI